MAGEWPMVAVESIAKKAASGPFGSNLRGSEYVVTGVPVIRGNNLSGPRFNDQGYVYVTDAKADELSSSLAYPRDVVFAARGSVGAVGIVPQGRHPRFLLSSNLMKVTVDPKKADAHFVFYYFRSRWGQNEILAHVNTTGVPKIERALESLRRFRVPQPPLRLQQAIACILGTLDDKIELNRRMNETLETMVQAIFKSWFMDFDPVRAKAAGQQPSGLAPAIADLFPDALEESELGEIPRGWKVLSVGDMCEFAYGRSLKASARKLGDIPVMGSNGQIGWHDSPFVTGPGIVVGRKGNPGVVTWVNSDFCSIDTTFYVVPRLTWVPLTYLYYALIGLDLPYLGADSAVPGLNRNIAYMSWLLLPSREILEVFARHIQLIMNRAYQGEQENRTLVALRDALLPKLISGELRVPDAELLLREAREC